MFFLLFLLDYRRIWLRIRIRTSYYWIRIRIQEAQKYTDSPVWIYKHADNTPLPGDKDDKK